MSIPLTINGVTFSYPQQGDKNWGPTLTNWSTAVTNGMLQKAGGTFTLTAEVNFGATFGIKLPYIKSTGTIAATGFLRLPNASSGLVWRNATDDGDLPLTVNASNQLTFNGISIGATTSLTNGHVLVGNVSNQPADVAMTGDITITNAGVTALGAGKVVDAQINASAAIALSKLAPTTAYYWYAANVSGVLTPLAITASRAIASDSNGLPSVSATTATELGYLSGVTSAIQTQITGKLSLSGGTMSGAISMGSNKVTALTQGSSSGEAIAFPVSTAQISAASITTALLAANAVSQVLSSASGTSSDLGTTITTKTITTTGGPVLIMASTYITTAGYSLSQSGASICVTRGGTSIAGGRGNHYNYNSTGSGPFVATCNLMVVDTPAAGTYTYNFTAASLTAQALSVQTYSLVLIELKA